MSTKFTVSVGADVWDLHEDLANAACNYRDEVSRLVHENRATFENLTQARERLFAVLNAIRPKTEQQAANDLLRASQDMAVAYERDVGECRPTIVAFERAYREYEMAVMS